MTSSEEGLWMAKTRTKYVDVATIPTIMLIMMIFQNSADVVDSEDEDEDEADGMSDDGSFASVDDLDGEISISWTLLFTNR